MAWRMRVARYDLGVLHRSWTSFGRMLTVLIVLFIRIVKPGAGAELTDPKPFQAFEESSDQRRASGGLVRSTSRRRSTSARSGSTRTSSTRPPTGRPTSPPAADRASSWCCRWERCGYASTVASTTCTSRARRRSAGGAAPGWRDSSGSAAASRPAPEDASRARSAVPASRWTTRVLQDQWLMGADLRVRIAGAFSVAMRVEPPGKRGEGRRGVPRRRSEDLVQSRRGPRCRRADPGRHGQDLAIGGRRLPA